jgi:hypothetical protein
MKLNKLLINRPITVPVILSAIVYNGCRLPPA